MKSGELVGDAGCSVLMCDMVGGRGVTEKEMCVTFGLSSLISEWWGRRGRWGWGVTWWYLPNMLVSDRSGVLR